MPSSLFLRAGAVLSALSTTTLATSSLYQLGDTYQGSQFLNGFNFFTDADPTNGFTQYQGQTAASNAQLVKNIGTDQYIGVDYQNTEVVTGSGDGRPSVRIETKTNYNEGLYIIDIKHMPGGICGTWPAFWSLGSGTWPKHGEIDIIEGVNANTANKFVLHTDTACSVNGLGQTDPQNLYNCSLDSTSGTSGCDVNAIEASTFGTGFNANGGGIYAMEWTTSAIKIWFFPRGNIPAAVLSTTPDTSLFGTPNANFQGDCDIPERFIDHRFIIDTTFCGDWAGAVYAQSGCPMYSGLDGQNSCKKFVAENPAAFKNAYWLISYFKTFTKIPVVSSSSSSSRSSTRSSTSSSRSSTRTSSSVATTTHSSSSSVSTSHASSSSSVSSTRASSSSSASSTRASSSSASSTHASSSSSASSTAASSSSASSTHASSSSSASSTAASSSSSSSSSHASSSSVSSTISSSSSQISTSAYPASTLSSTSVSSSHSSSASSSTVYPTGTSTTIYPNGTTTGLQSSSTPCSTSTSSSAAIYPSGSADSYPVSSSAVLYGDHPITTPAPYSAGHVSKPYGYGYNVSAVTTTYTTSYVDVCETGYTTKHTTYTATYYPAKTTSTSAGEETCAPGFTITSKYCATGCGAYPTTVTVTVPITETAYEYVTESAEAHYTPSAKPYSSIKLVSSSAPKPYGGEEATTIVQTKVITLSVVPVPASEYQIETASSVKPAYSAAPVQSSAAPAGGYPVYSETASPVKHASSAAPVYSAPAYSAPAQSYPVKNSTASYAATGTGKPAVSTTGSHVPYFTGAASSVKVSGVIGGAVAAIMVLFL